MLLNRLGSAERAGRRISPASGKVVSVSPAVPCDQLGNDEGVKEWPRRCQSRRGFFPPSLHFQASVSTLISTVRGRRSLSLIPLTGVSWDEAACAESCPRKTETETETENLHDHYFAAGSATPGAGCALTVGAGGGGQGG